MLELKKPVGPYISSASAKKLYQLEEQRDQYIEACAEELMKVLNLSNMWDEAIPEALLAVLESHGKAQAVAAASAFLEKNGYTVTKS